MAYTPNPIDSTQPVGSVAAGTAAAEFRAIKSYLGGVLGNVQSFNALDSTPSLTVSNGNLTVTKNATTGQQTAIRAAFSKSSGKWYWEVTILSFLAANQQILGIATSLFDLTNYVGSDTQSYGYGGASGDKYINGSSSGFGAAFAVNDVIGFAFDADGNTLQVFKNNASQGTITGLTAGAYFPAVGELTLADSLTGVFDAKSLKYAPPAGFSAFYDSDTAATAYASITLANNQALGDGVQTPVLFDTVAFDSETWWNTGSFYYQPKTAGKYRVTATLFLLNTNNFPMALAICSIAKNGVEVKRFITGSAASEISSSCSAIVDMNGSTDTLQGLAQINTGAAGDLVSAGANNTWIDFEYLGP